MPVNNGNDKMDVDTDDNIMDEPSTSRAGPSGLCESKLSSQTSLNNVMASPSVVPSVTVSLHPLVIMNISEHWTRIRAQSGMANQGTNSLSFSSVVDVDQSLIL